MYHGIGSVDIDPWGLFVSPENFAQHLQVLGELTRPAPLRRLIDDAAGGELAPRSVAVTFDDGYANVLHVAEPILSAHSTPATLFVVSQPLVAASEYWWDELAGLLLQPGSLPPQLELRGPSATIELALGSATSYGHRQWERDRAYRDGEGPASPRMELYRTLWDRFSPLDHAERQHLLSELATWSGRPRLVRDTHRSLTVEELVALDGGPVEVGGHTVTHPLLPGLDPERLRIEIEDNKRCLEGLLHREVVSFSYPFGANDPAAVGAVERAGYRLAVAARPDTVAPGDDPFRIGRFDVKNWTGAEFERRLRGWFRYR
jgi:peptidoglycan/xylan/chitin deacetylase (PgdA/CDA1 family)